MLCSSLMMVQKDEFSPTQGTTKCKIFYAKDTTPASEVTKLYKKQCQILRSLSKRKIIVRKTK